MEKKWLVEKAKKGDEEAFFTLISTHKEQLYRIAYSYLKNEADSLEAIQEVTYRAFKGIRKLKEADYFSTWLVRIMINYCRDEWKKKKREPNMQMKKEEPYTEDNDLQLEVQEAISLLGDPYQTVIQLRYMEDFMIKDIAKVMDSPENTVKTWLRKGLEKLRQYWDEKGGSKHV
ncbi:sigma-70 family RNA polymerase sigma factor [Sutcliffiella horikoshii]|uniref:Sigma-70 family RNA polymerase sigma factor n=1 Tax=Sutcliffiella horikoshii TaxID=79883 RepID=A0A5D4T5M4_9BACI|nr:sigma-70 family RNA polymerase sigma factor [Sutcliffiella horikoshii]TYS70873.1 sigma-70 family RNA polymerase sigma factor [Sutcliffiella horikoshii]